MTSRAELGRHEQQVASLLLQGCSNREIAAELDMKLRTVKRHFDRMFRKFRISKRGIKRVKLAIILYRRQLELGLVDIAEEEL